MVYEVKTEIREQCQELILTDKNIFEIMKRFTVEIERGLKKETHPKADIKCFVTYVQDLPNGKEKGKFLALDLGGTNFRVLLIHLKGENEFEMQSKIYAIPQVIMLGSGEQLFDHIAECLSNFMKEHAVYEERLPLGFTFSFPLKQLGLTKGILEKWTKGFNCSGVVGEDVVQLLKDAIARRGDICIAVMAILNDSTGTLMSCAHRNHDCKIGIIVEHYINHASGSETRKSIGTQKDWGRENKIIKLLIPHLHVPDVKIEVCAILNDTTGTLMSCAWKNHNTRIGLICGTGSNACYVEKVENAELFDCPENTRSHVLINTEWGAFGDNGALDFVRTEYDREVDRSSINPGKQLQEKMISGMYLGELARLAIVRFTKAGLLFGGVGSDLLYKKGQFFTKYVSEIETDKPGSYTYCMEVLEELGLEHATDQDCANVRYICECVSSRAAHLVSAGIAGLINKMDEKSVTVGVDGSVYRFHPKFHDLMMAKIRQFVKSDISFDLMLSEDGSGRGAALVAAVASRQEQESA